MRTWLFWRPHRPYGSIVFNHSRGGAGSGSSNSGGGALTTNIYTSWGAATVSDAIATVSETQSQLQNQWRTLGTPLGCLWEWLSLRLLEASPPQYPV